MIELLLAVALAAAPEFPQKGDTIHLPVKLVRSVHWFEMKYLNIPYDRLNCPGTYDCRYSVEACAPLKVRKVKKDRIIADADLGWLLSPAWRPAMYRTPETCAAAIGRPLPPGPAQVEP